MVSHLVTRPAVNEVTGYVCLSGGKGASEHPGWAIAEQIFTDSIWINGRGMAIGIRYLSG